MQRPFLRELGASTVRTLLPTIAPSIIAVVLMPTTAALWTSESKKSARASALRGSAPSRGQTAALPRDDRSNSRQRPACVRMGPDENPDPAQRLHTAVPKRCAPARDEVGSGVWVIAGFEQT